MSSWQKCRENLDNVVGFALDVSLQASKVADVVLQGIATPLDMDPHLTDYMNMNQDLFEEFKKCSINPDETLKKYYFHVLKASEEMDVIIKTGRRLSNAIFASLRHGPVIKETDALKITKLKNQVVVACYALSSRVDLVIRSCSKDADNYNSLDEVPEALFHAGLLYSKLIIGVGFNKSNWLGNGRSLHAIESNLNPYEQAISIIGKTLVDFDDDNLIPCFGFGDASTTDRDVFSFYPEEKPCNGFEEVLNRYREIVPNLFQTGSISFTPIIEKAMAVVEGNGGLHHTLVIVANEPINSSVAPLIEEASKFPLSIVLVGVGDGPWNSLRGIPVHRFNNFHFVNLTEIMREDVNQTSKEINFALKALLDIPNKFKEAALLLDYLGGLGVAPRRVARPPPVVDTCSGSSTTCCSIYHSCPICLANPTDLALGCGHLICVKCDKKLKICPICRVPVKTKMNILIFSVYEKCPMCFTNTVDMVFGCRHLTCCTCGEKFVQCPMCTVQIKRRIKLFP